MTKSGLYAPDGSYYVTLTDGQGNISSNNFIVNQFDFMGDSRTVALQSAVTTAGLAANHWFNWANFLNKKKYRLGLNLGISALRTDQYINQTLFQALASKAQWCVMDLGCINDLAAQPGGSFPYTDTNGVVVTSTTVGAVAANNVINAAKQLVAVGKNVILTQEIGSTTITQTSVGQMYDYNYRLQAFADATPNVYIWNAGPTLWNATSSGTAVAFKANYMQADGTHFQPLGAYNMAIAFNTFFNNLIAVPDFSIANINDVQVTNARQLIQNPLFNTLTGGAVTTMTLTSGTMPSGWSMSGAASSSVVITSAADAVAGNAVTFAVTTTGADTVVLQSNSPSNNNWNLTDVIDGGCDVTVATGSTNFLIFWDTQINTDQGTVDGFDMYSSAIVGVFPTTGFSGRYQTLPNQVKPGSVSKGFLNGRLYIQATAAGTATITVSRAFLRRRLIYTTGSGLFTG